MDFKQLIFYLKELVDEHEQLKELILVTHYEEILSLQLDRSLYPALVVEMPSIEISEEGGVRNSFEFNWLVIKGLPRDEKFSYYFNELSGIFEIVQSVHQKMFCDAEDDIFDAELDSVFDPVIKTTADNCYGWRGSAVLSNFETQ